MAYNRNHYNPDALPAHVEPDQAAAMLSKDRDRDRDRRPASKPQPPVPQSSSSRYDSRYDSRPQDSRYDSRPGADRYDSRPSDSRYDTRPPPDPRYDDRRTGSGHRMSSGGAAGYGGMSSPPPQNYGYERMGPPPQAHDRPPINSFRPPSMPMPPKDPNDRDALWPMFRAVDKDGSGQLSEQELRRALVNGDWSAFDEHTVRMMIRMFDADRNGSISFDEFCGLWSFLSAWRNLFDRFDVDRSGNISLDEFQEALVAFGYKLSPPFVRTLFKTYDRRGQNAMSFDLFVQACISLKRMTDVFKKYDEDRDGYITLSFEEFLTEILRQMD